MSLFDRAINVATDAARSSAANYQRAQRIRAVHEQIAAQQQLIAQASARIGRLSLTAANAGYRLPDSTRPAAEAIHRWQAELADLQRQLHQLGAAGG